MFYKFEFVENPQIDSLKKKWTSLEAEIQPHFFLTWGWIGTWLQSYQPTTLLALLAYDKNETLVSIALFTLSQTSRHGFIQSRQLRLHQTGKPAQDQIWIEYNNFLVHPSIQHDVIQQGLTFIQTSPVQWDEIIISMAQKENTPNFSLKNCSQKVLRTSPSFSVDLNNLRQKNQTYLTSLSRNTRYQINKSKKNYTRLLGEITLKKARTVDEALKYFHIAGQMHIQRWADSGFKNPEFIKFHEQLITNRFKQHNIDLFLLLSGDEIIGASYYFIENKHVYFYLSGLSYEHNNKYKPGLLLHSMIIQHYLDEHFFVYDFMGGYSQYKKSLSNNNSTFIILCLQKKRMKFLIENIARTLKHKIQNNQKDT